MMYSQGGSDETDEITDDTSAKGEDDGVASASLEKEEILDVSLSFTGLYRLAWGDDTGEESWFGGSKLEDRRGENGREARTKDTLY